MKHVATLTIKRFVVKKQGDLMNFKIEKIGEKIPGSTTIKELQKWADGKCLDGNIEFIKLEISKSL